MRVKIRVLVSTTQSSFILSVYCSYALMRYSTNTCTVWRWYSRVSFFSLWLSYRNNFFLDVISHLLGRYTCVRSERTFFASMTSFDIIICMYNVFWHHYSHVWDFCWLLTPEISLWWVFFQSMLYLIKCGSVNVAGKVNEVEWRKMAQLSVVRHNETLLQELEPGDLIEFPREYYSHWAVYIGVYYILLIVRYTVISGCVSFDYSGL